MENEAALDALRGLEIHHLGYKVDSLEATARAWNKLGIGPFFYFRDMPFDALESDHSDEPRFLHSAAFGFFGNVGIELQEITDAYPARMHVELGCAGPDKLNHLAYAMENPDDYVKMFVDAGYPRTVYTRAGERGDMKGTIEDTSHFIPELGHTVEFHIASDALEGFWGKVRDENHRWDGTDGYRPAEPLLH